MPESFAGFTYPRRIARIDRSKPPGKRVCAAYYLNKPAPNQGGAFFYLESDFMPGLRWQWADKVEGVRIRHEGWYADPDMGGDTIRGIVFRLPHGRGFLAGHSMGEGMATTIATVVYAEESSAAYAADRMAERAAEIEREWQESWRAGMDAGQAWAESMGKALDRIQAARTMRKAARVAMARALSARSGEAMGFLPPGAADEARGMYRQALESMRDKVRAACDMRREAWRTLAGERACHDRAAFREGFLSF